MRVVLDGLVMVTETVMTKVELGGALYLAAVIGVLLTADNPSTFDRPTDNANKAKTYPETSMNQTGFSMLVLSVVAALTGVLPRKSPGRLRWKPGPGRHLRAAARPGSDGVLGAQGPRTHKA